MTRRARYAAVAGVLLFGAAIALAIAAVGGEGEPTARPSVTLAGTTTAAETSGEETSGKDAGETTTGDPADTLGETTTTGVTTPVTTVEPAPPPPYALAPTRLCLRSAGFDVSTVRSDDPRLRALGDLAQKTSLELSRDGQVLGLALGDTRLLVSLLRVPNDPYRLEAVRNALLMYRPGARSEAAVVRSCLRT